MTIIDKALAAEVIHPPAFLPTNTHYLINSGSHSYGCSGPESDWDVVGWCIPPKDIVLPHTVGRVQGFDLGGNKFDQWQEHHIKFGDSEYDFTVYNVVTFFKLVADNNPNMIDALYAPESAIRHITRLGQLVRDNRNLFLHKGAWHRFRGYAHSQLHKLRTSKPTGKRAELVEKFGFDSKHAYHVVRLMCEIEQILSVGDIDLARDAELYKAVRRGDWTFEQIEQFFVEKEKALEPLYHSSPLPYSIQDNYEKLRALLWNVLEEHYGSIGSMPGAADRALSDIAAILRRGGYA